MKFQRGVITLVFDDGYESILRNVVPILNKYGMHGVFGVAVEGSRIEATEKRPVAPMSEWLKIANDGHEVASHSVTHRDLTKLSDAQLDAELKDSQATLKADTIIYPGGACDERVALAAKAYYSAGRALVHGFETLPPANNMRLRAFNFSRRNFSVWKANLLAAWAWLTNTWLIETYHLVGDPDPVAIHNVDLDGFEAHIRFISKLPVKVSTIRDIMIKK